ncbi:alpha/beta fold hydrolase [Amnibacterium flavum]|uniref:AB hydrolase-1 domain-containing protein n=1 Tax=Amnibacterium flavum TaxID=2173173 RepID=A0A2V1HSD4_9MICO|nr:alpha/beta hydrolase [Amnibacterium flavum]PVZ94582.1 hypothetical protein DDQ50_12860 [Amnibacterium flavum]
MSAPFAPLESQCTTVAGRTVEFFDNGVARDADPVVVLLTGAGETVRSWLPVQARLAGRHRVLAFERSGIGGSEAGSPRTLEGLIAELTGVLDSLVPEARVVLVGHSFGALLSRVFAERNAARVAGLVLLDATPDLLGTDALRRVGYRLYIGAAAVLRRALPRDWFGRLTAAGALPFYPGRSRFLRLLDGASAREWKRAVKDLYLGDAIEEMRAVLPVAAEAAGELAVGTRGRTGRDLPVAMLTSGTYGPGWTRLHRTISQRYPGSSHEVTQDRFHNVHMRHPDLTVQIVEAVLAQARVRWREPG